MQYTTSTRLLRRRLHDGYSLQEPGRHRHHLAGRRVEAGVERGAGGHWLALLVQDLVREAEARPPALAHPASHLEQVVETRRLAIADQRLHDREMDPPVDVRHRQALLAQE